MNHHGDPSHGTRRSSVHGDDVARSGNDALRLHCRGVPGTAHGGRGRVRRSQGTALRLRATSHRSSHAPGRAGIVRRRDRRAVGLNPRSPNPKPKHPRAEGTEARTSRLISRSTAPALFFVFWIGIWALGFEIALSAAVSAQKTAKPATSSLRLAEAIP